MAHVQRNVCCACLQNPEDRCVDLHSGSEVDSDQVAPTDSAAVKQGRHLIRAFVQFGVGQPCALAFHSDRLESWSLGLRKIDRHAAGLEILSSSRSRCLELSHARPATEVVVRKRDS